MGLGANPWVTADAEAGEEEETNEVGFMAWCMLLQIGLMDAMLEREEEEGEVFVMLCPVPRCVAGEDVTRDGTMFLTLFMPLCVGVGCCMVEGDEGEGWFGL